MIDQLLALLIFLLALGAGILALAEPLLGAFLGLVRSLLKLAKGPIPPIVFKDKDKPQA